MRKNIFQKDFLAHFLSWLCPPPSPTSSSSSHTRMAKLRQSKTSPRRGRGKGRKHPSLDEKRKTFKHHCRSVFGLLVFEFLHSFLLSLLLFFRTLEMIGQCLRSMGQIFQTEILIHHVLVPRHVWQIDYVVCIWFHVLGNKSLLSSDVTSEPLLKGQIRPSGLQIRTIFSDGGSVCVCVCVCVCAARII